MKKILLTALIFASAFAQAQYRTDFGILVGGANYLGEIGGNELTRRDFLMDMKLNQTKKSFGTFIRHRFNNSIGVTGSILYGEITGADNMSANPGRKGRNLSFNNNILEVSGRTEVYLYNVYDVGGHSRYLMDFRPYVFAGLGAFYHNPKAEIDGQSYELRGLKTEGQQDEYAKINVAIPMGLGFYMTYNKRYRVSCELGWRKTFTDYLDDVSTEYADASELDSELAIVLANRHHEVANEEGIPNENNYTAGNKRGDATHNDSYLMAHVGMSYVMRGRYINTIQMRGGYIPKVRYVRHKF